jgi:hypothetical protein
VGGWKLAQQTGGVGGYRISIPPPHIFVTPTWSNDDNRSPYRRCRHYTTMILDHQKIFESTADLARWLANLTAERNHLNFRDRRSRSRDRRSNSRSSSSRMSPSRHDTANNFWPGTTNATKIEKNVVPSPAPSTCKGNWHNWHQQRHPTSLQPPATSPSLTRPVKQTLVPNRHGFAPPRVPSQAHPSAQVAHSLRPLRG